MQLLLRRASCTPSSPFDWHDVVLAPSCFGLLAWAGLSLLALE